ncbi:MAG: energy transducer TonB [Pseudobdellovibrionaceae bacterium]
MSAHSETRKYGFVLLSTFTHVALAAGVMSLTLKSDIPTPTTIEVTAEDTPLPVVSEAPVQAEKAKPAEAPAVDLPQKEAPVAKLAPAPAPTPAPKAAKPKAAAPKAVVATALPAAKHEAKEAPVTQEESPVVIPATTTASEEIAEEVKTDDTEETVAAATEDLSQQAEKDLQEQEEKLAAIQKRNEEEAAEMAKADEMKRQEEKKALAAAATAKALAAEKAAEEARQAEAARLAKEAKIAQDQAQAVQGTSTAGTGGNGDVRSIEDLKPVPGNKRPQYDADDRLRRRQGDVAFIAYVTKEGMLTDFKMMKSSGHRELDAKTLKALKTWKFYPGQEGWVEIPVQWDLKGEAKEKPATLRVRSQVSQNQ